MARFRSSVQVNALFLGTAQLALPMVWHLLPRTQLRSMSAALLWSVVGARLLGLPVVLGPNVLLVAGALRLWTMAMSHAWDRLLVESAA